MSAPDPFAVLAQQVLGDASLRQRVRSAGPPAGVQPLGRRELQSSIAGVVLAAGGESLVLVHAAGSLGTEVASAAHHVVAHTNLDQLRSVLGLDHSSSGGTRLGLPTVEPNPEALPPVPVQTPVLYEPPSAGTGTSDAAADLGGVGIGPWPGNVASPEAIAQWMGDAAQSAGLPRALPVMAALVESNLNNNACCNADSLGYFQMRASVWNQYPYAGYYQHPVLQVWWFIEQALTVKSEHVAAGDVNFGQDPSTWGTWVADIEQPAAQFRGRYADQLSAAQALVGSGSLAPGGSPFAAAPTEVATSPPAISGAGASLPPSPSQIGASVASPDAVSLAGSTPSTGAAAGADAAVPSNDSFSAAGAPSGTGAASGAGAHVASLRDAILRRLARRSEGGPAFVGASATPAPAALADEPTFKAR
ncbi:MAG TPA: hypothetical protein VHX88_05810 [Solirubrobacteraceae bacterium]|nr:hypothetical protein [Solirubrobacteraceae bacterium]